MTHLTPDELVDLMDGTLPSSRRAHLDACDACRTAAADMGAVLERVAAEAVPEPSPLFWDHLSARVRDAIDTPAPRGWRDWLTRPAAAWATALATIALAVGLTYSLEPRFRPAAPAPMAARLSSARLPASAASLLDTEDDIEKDEAWALVRTVADDVSWDATQAAGIAPRPGSAERMALEMSAREQSELARLLETELKRPGM
jgi:hypothetical protein